MAGRRMGTPPEGDEEREVVPAAALLRGIVLGLGVVALYRPMCTTGSRAEADDEVDEFKLSFRRRFIARPEADVMAGLEIGVGFAIVALPLVIAGNGLGGGISAVEPVLALGPMPTLATREGIRKRSATLVLCSLTPPLVPPFTVLPVDEALPIPIALGGLPATGAFKLDPLIESRCLCRSNVGTNAGWPSTWRSNDRNPDDSIASRSSSWKN